MWSLDKLKEWARPALRYEELVAIARIAPSARQAKNQALEFTKNKGLGEEIAKACRWLMIIRRDYGLTQQEEYISSAKEAMAREERKMEKKKIKKDKKRTKKGWPLYYCSLCQKYQQVEGKCKYCGLEKTERKVVKTEAEYCELLGKHAYKQVGRSGTIGESLLVTYHLERHRCIRCGQEKTESGYDVKD